MSETIAIETQLIDCLKLPSQLRPYQWEGIRFLVESDGALLADEMGLGKTVQVAVALEILWRKRQLTRTLVVVPASLKLNWETELRRWAPSLSVQRVRGAAPNRRAYYLLPINVIVASYEEVRLDIMDFTTSVQFDVVVLDEAQRIKNINSKSSLACRLLKRSRSWALSGTPIENKIHDLISIFRFVKIGVLTQGLSRTEIHSRMYTHFLRRRKREVLKDLPPMIDQLIPVELEGNQENAYRQAWEKRWERSGSQSQDHSPTNLLAIITRLKQLCNYDVKSGESAKFDVLLNILENHVDEEDKLIIFSQYVDTLQWMALRLKDIPLDVFHGGLNHLEREQILIRFRNKPGPRCLLVSLRAGGVGLNIPEASTVILFDRWWNPAVENQAVQRAHRFGRASPLHVVRFIVLNTIEERISNIIGKKHELFQDYVEAAANIDIPRLSKELLEQILELPTSM